jgi:hypothetical protein
MWELYQLFFPYILFLFQYGDLQIGHWIGLYFFRGCHVYPQQLQFSVLLGFFGGGFSTVEGSGLSLGG